MGSECQYTLTLTSNTQVAHGDSFLYRGKGLQTKVSIPVLGHTAKLPSLSAILTLTVADEATQPPGMACHLRAGTAAENGRRH